MSAAAAGVVSGRRRARLQRAIETVGVVLCVALVAPFLPGMPEAGAAVYPQPDSLSSAYRLEDIDAEGTLWVDPQGRTYHAWVVGGEYLGYGKDHLYVVRVLPSGQPDPDFVPRDFAVGAPFTDETPGGVGHDCSQPSFTAGGTIALVCRRLDYSQGWTGEPSLLEIQRGDVYTWWAACTVVETWSLSGNKTRTVVRLGAAEVESTDGECSDGGWPTDDGRLVTYSVVDGSLKFYLVGSAAVPIPAGDGLWDILSPGPTMDHDFDVVQLDGGAVHLVRYDWFRDSRVVTVAGDGVTDREIECSGQSMAAFLPGRGTEFGYVCGHGGIDGQVVVTHVGERTWSRTVPGCNLVDQPQHRPGFVEKDDDIPDQSLQDSVVIACQRTSAPLGPEIVRVRASGALVRSGVPPEFAQVSQRDRAHMARVEPLGRDRVAIVGWLDRTDGGLDKVVTTATLSAAIEPGVPVIGAATAGNGSARVSWSAPASDGGAAITGYVVTPYLGATAQPARVFASTATTQTVTGLTNGSSYTFRVAATNVVGTGVKSEASNAVTPVAPYRPFASWDAFVAQQLLDFTGSSGTAASRAPLVAQLSAGSVTPAAFIRARMEGAWFAGNMAPVARLYWAYFGRIPDYSGVSYWTGRRRAGTGLNTVSQSFAGSAEFARIYGLLSNSDFVRLVYQNVLGRPPDAAGLAYWTAQLDQGTKTRGQVMTGFSESAEYKTKMATRVTVVLVHAGLLHRAPSAVELDAGIAQSSTALIEAKRLSTEYAARVT